MKNPIPEIAARTMAQRAWCCGMGRVLRFSHTRSPKVTFEPQLSVFLGGGNSLGLSQIHKPATPKTGKLHQPRGRMLHTAPRMAGRPVNTRVQTLHGLAWHCQVASSIAISFVKMFLLVCEVFWFIFKFATYVISRLRAFSIRYFRFVWFINTRQVFLMIYKGFPIHAGRDRFGKSD